MYNFKLLTQIYATLCVRQMKVTRNNNNSHTSHHNTYMKTHVYYCRSLPPAPPPPRPTPDMK